MDIYGELLVRATPPIPHKGRPKERSKLKFVGCVVQDSVYIYNKFSPISYDLWCYIRKIVDFVADNWHLKDHGTHEALDIVIEGSLLTLWWVAKECGRCAETSNTSCIRRS